MIVPTFIIVSLNKEHKNKNLFIDKPIECKEGIKDQS